MALKKKQLTPPSSPKPKDEVVEILQDIRITLDEILELMKSELEEDEPEHPATVPQQSQGPV